MRAARLVIVGTAVAVFIAGGLLAWIYASAPPTAPDPDDRSLVARGKAVYAEQCAACHGAQLEGQPDWRKRLPNGRLRAPPHDASGHTWHHSDRQLFAMVKNGASGLVPGRDTDMPAYKGILSDSEIWAVLSFIESTWPPDIRARQHRLSRSSP